MLVLLPITITGCRTTKVEYIVVLPPKPVRQEITPPKNVSECAEVINYYDSLVKLWEAWGETVEKTVEKMSPTLYKNVD